MERHANFLREQAARCRRLAAQLTDRELARTLLALGEDYARKAEAWDDATGGREPAERVIASPAPAITERH